MREINEYTAEVFRRSEKRIKERKRKRNSILMCCIPLFVCLTVFSAAVLPSVMKSKSSNFFESVGDAGSATYGNMEINDEIGSIACSFMQARIQNVGTFSEHYEELVTDKLRVDQMYFLICDIFEISKAEKFSETAEAYSTEDGSVSKAAAYVFTFTTAEGDEATYSLNGNKLVANETGETVYLSADQLDELRKVFRLPN